jgi:magnesium transporter
MNFDFMPELKMKLSYPIVLGVMAMLSLGNYLWFKRKGWL